MSAKRLYRSRTERKISGVCGGLAEYFSADPTVVRVLFLAAALLWGGGFVLYLIMAFVVPEAPLAEESPKVSP